MSITFNIKRQGIVDTINIPGSDISAYLLQKLIAQKLKTKQQDLTLLNAFTGLKLNPMQILKDKSIIDLQRQFKSEAKVNVAGIVSNQQLIQMGKKARFFMIKSSNQQNIQKAREFSVWATTCANQDKLRSALLYSPNVFLFFATNRSYQVKGLARMQKQPSKVPEKAFWSGVSNIRLGGNFQIRWIRKQPLTSLQIQKALGSQIKDRVMRLSDGQQVDGQFAQKILPLFQIPTQPYYTVKQQQPQTKSTQGIKKIPILGQILGGNRQMNLMFPPPSAPNTISPPAVRQVQKPIVIPKKQEKQQNNKRKQNKAKKNNNSKEESSSYYSSSSDSYSSKSRSESPSSSRSKDKKKKKIKKEKKSKKKEKKTSRSRSKVNEKKKKSKKDKKKKKNKKKN